MEENPDNTPDDEPAGAIFREIAVVAGVVFALVLAASIGAQYSGLVSQYLYLIVAAVFIYVPFWLLEQKGLSFREFGLAMDRPWRNGAIGLALLAATAVPFAGGYYLWETYAVGHSYEFDWENYRKWSPRLEGRPDGWGDGPGVWVWTKDREVHLGMRTGPAGRMKARLSLDRPAVPTGVGRVEVTPVGVEKGADAPGDYGPAREWQLYLEAPNKRAEVTLEPRGPGTAGYPARVDVSIEPRTDAAGLYVGPGAEPVGREYGLDRGLRWILLWLLTQVAFIALPEEFFYRGYLQTRIRHALAARRREAGEEGDEAVDGTRSWLGISEENVAASAMFGVAHLLIPVGGQIIATRISVFFPALVFGWLRDRTGSITASVVYHAGCNMLVLLAAPHFF